MEVSEDDHCYLY